jgi:hypothetical protein
VHSSASRKVTLTGGGVWRWEEENGSCKMESRYLRGSTGTEPPDHTEVSGRDFPIPKSRTGFPETLFLAEYFAMAEIGDVMKPALAKNPKSLKHVWCS